MAGTEILQFCLRPGYPQAEGRSAVLEAAQARNELSGAAISVSDRTLDALLGHL